MYTVVDTRLTDLTHIHVVAWREWTYGDALLTNSLTTSIYRNTRSTEIWSNTRKGQARLVCGVFHVLVLWFHAYCYIELLPKFKDTVFSSRDFIVRVFFFFSLSRICRVVSINSSALCSWEVRVISRILSQFLKMLWK